MKSGNQLSAPTLLRETGLLLLFNLAIALFLTIITEYDLQTNMVFSQAIGLSIYLISILLHRALGLGRPTVWPTIIAIPFGTVIGVSIATLFLDNAVTAAIFQQSGTWSRLAIASLVFGTAIGYYFYAQAHISETRRALEAEAMRRAKRERDLAEARLKLLQGQIEPHFLFNVHSNILSLMESQPEEAKVMLEALTQYLRGSLRHLRQPLVTLQDEIALLESYLSIQSIRMGKRLSYQIDLPTALADTLIPPLLIQPLVENALIHGLEPSVEGGHIHISAQQSDNSLLIEVRDSGLGFQEPTHEGIGLENIRDRLKRGYAEAGRLEIRENKPRGILARIRLPLEHNEVATS